MTCCLFWISVSLAASSRSDGTLRIHGNTLESLCALLWSTALPGIWRMNLKAKFPWTSEQVYPNGVSSPLRNTSYGLPFSPGFVRGGNWW